MERVTGIGGIFFKAQNPEQLKEWYRAHLGIEPNADGSRFGLWESVTRMGGKEYGVGKDHYD